RESVGRLGAAAQAIVEGSGGVNPAILGSKTFYQMLAGFPDSGAGVLGGSPIIRQLLALQEPCNPAVSEGKASLLHILQATVDGIGHNNGVARAALVEAFGSKPIEREQRLWVIFACGRRGDLFTHLIDEFQCVPDGHRGAVGIEYLRIAREDA